MPSLFTLAEAANSLGVSSSTLKHQAQKGVLHATLMGKTYIVTAEEIARYRREHLGKTRRLGAAGKTPRTSG
jgi:excisionase family DNA binding protein